MQEATLDSLETCSTIALSASLHWALRCTVKLVTTKSQMGTTDGLHCAMQNENGTEEETWCSLGVNRSGIGGH